MYHLKKQNKIIAIFAGVMLIILQTITVFAESNTNTLSLKLAEYDKESRNVKVYCEMQAKDKVTNGKLRITYDSKQLKLVSSEKGKALKNGMCEINDCLTGNKKEGEIVAAFASAENLPEEGYLLEFSFEVAQSVKEEDTISVELKAEKLSDDSDVQANVKNLTFTLKDGTVEAPSDDSKKDDKETGNSSTSKTQDNKNKTQTNSSGSSNSSSSSKSGTTSKQNPVITGDDTKILPFVITGGAALVIIAAGIISKKKQK